MNKNIKKIISVNAIVFILALAYLGSYRPLMKSKIYINATRSISGPVSVKEFKETMAKVLDFYSPVGQEEIVRQTGTTIINIIQNTQEPAVIEDLINFLESYFKPIIDQGHGMSFSQDLHILGTANEIALIKTGQPRYLEASKKYYTLAREIGPKRPQPLYGLFDIYRIENNQEKLEQVVNQILEQWPSDETTRKIYSDYLEGKL